MISTVPQWIFSVTLEDGRILTGTVADNFLSNAIAKVNALRFDGAVMVTVQAKPPQGPAYVEYGPKEGPPPTRGDVQREVNRLESEREEERKRDVVFAEGQTWTQEQHDARRKDLRPTLSVSGVDDSLQTDQALLHEGPKRYMEFSKAQHGLAKQVADKWAPAWATDPRARHKPALFCCAAPYPDQPWRCSRPKGHKAGPHVASSSIGDIALAWWPSVPADGKEAPTAPQVETAILTDVIPDKGVTIFVLQTPSAGFRRFDQLEIEACESVNPVTLLAIGVPMRFTVTSDAALANQTSGWVQVSVHPPVIARGQFKNVSRSPQPGDVVRVYRA